MGVAWPAFIWSPINVAIAFGAGVIMTKYATAPRRTEKIGSAFLSLCRQHPSRIVRPAANMRRELVVACTFSNGVALPLVLGNPVVPLYCLLPAQAAAAVPQTPPDPPACFPQWRC
eukprot:scaffold1828_cov258-Pinguiococcus_pyrenoidosus.AAC.9